MNPLDPVSRSISARIAPAIVASALLLALVACGNKANGDAESPDRRSVDSDELAVVGAALDRPANPALGAIRLEIVNGTPEVVVLVGVSSPDGDASIHRSDLDDEGRSVMNHIDQLEIPGRSSRLFEPGGLHVMLSGITADLEVGDTVELTLEFDRHDPITVDVPVVDPLDPLEAGADEGLADDHDHDQEAHAPPRQPATTDSGAV